MKALVHWRPYLGWTKFPFTIMTDHANLQYWKSPKNLNRRTARWHADLQEYNYEILYVLGKANMPPDALLRPPGANKGKTDNQNIIVTVDKSVREEDRSDDEEKDENVENVICQLLDQRAASQRRDKSCTPSH